MVLWLSNPENAVNQRELLIPRLSQWCYACCSCRCSSFTSKADIYAIPNPLVPFDILLKSCTFRRTVHILHSTQFRPLAWNGIATPRFASGLVAQACTNCNVTETNADMEALELVDNDTPYRTKITAANQVYILAKWSLLLLRLTAVAYLLKVKYCKPKQAMI